SFQTSFGVRDNFSRHAESHALAQRFEVRRCIRNLVVQHRNPKRPHCRNSINRYHVTPYVNDVGVYLPGDLEKLEEKTRVFFQILPLYDMQRDVKIVKLLVMYFIPREDDLQLNILILL